MYVYFFLKLNKIIIFVLSLLSLPSILLLIVVYYHIIIRLLFILTECSYMVKANYKKKQKQEKKIRKNTKKMRESPLVSKK